MQTPHKRSFAAEELARQKSKKSKLWIPFGIAVVVLTVAGYLLYARYQARESVSPGAVSIKSIAVLPLESFNDDPFQIHFTDAMHSAIITNLSRICAGIVRVSAQRSTIQYRKSDKTASEIAQELDVDAVIEGDVYSSDNQVRITVQLIAMNPERHLWTNVYTEEMKNVLSLQNQVAQAIAGEIKVAVSVEEATRLTRMKTVDPEAYNLYVQGQQYVYEVEYEKAAELLQEAIKKDPMFAQAHSLLSIIYRFDYIEKAKTEADRALELDPSLAEPHMTYAYLYQRTFDWQKAESECKQALVLDPSNSEVNSFYATHLRMRCRYEDALQRIAVAQNIDPLNPFSYGAAVAIYAAMDRFDEAIEQYRRGMNFIPDHPYIKQHYGRMLYKQGKYEESTEMFRGTVFGTEGRFGYIHALAGNREEAGKVLNKLIDDTQNVSTPSSDITYIIFIYAAIGETKKALDWLERMYADGSHNLLFIKTDFEYDPLRNEPRFQALLKKMNLAD